MAYAYPKFTSGEGNVLDRNGIIASEKFVVYKDTPRDDVVDILQFQIVNDPWGRTGVPAGQPHPRPNWKAAKVRGYQETEILTEYVSECIVTYSTDDPDDGAYGGWLGEFEFQSSTVQIGRSVEFVDARGVVIEKQKPIGVPWFRLTKADEPHSHIAVNPDTGAELKFVLVNNPDGTTAIRRERFDQIKIDGLWTFTRVIPRYSFAMGRAIKSMAPKVNASDWNGHKAHTMMFLGHKASEESVLDKATNVMKKQHRITVSFIYNENGLLRHNIVATYTDPESGAELTIVDNVSRKPVEVGYVVYPTVSFDSIFSVLGVTKPVDRAR